MSKNNGNAAMSQAAFSVPRFLFCLALVSAAGWLIIYGIETNTDWQWLGFVILAYFPYSLLANSRLPWAAPPKIDLGDEEVPMIDGRRGSMSFIIPKFLQSLENIGVLVRKKQARTFVTMIGSDMEGGQNMNVLEKVDIRCAGCGIKISNAWLMQMLIEIRDPSMMPIFTDVPGALPDDDGTCPRCLSDNFAIIYKVR